MPSMYRKNSSLQHQNTLWNMFGYSVRNSEQRPLSRWEDAVMRKALSR